MELSASTTCNFDTSPVISVDASDVSDNNFQPFFVLHKAGDRKCERTTSSSYGRTKRKIDMPAVQEENDTIYQQLRLESFESTWSKIDSTVKEVLREINTALFEEIHQSQRVYAIEWLSCIFSLSIGYLEKAWYRSCLRSLYQQLVSKVSDVVHIPLIASWYNEDENYDKPIVVIIDDIERCDSAVLSDFIKMLSEWMMKIPIIFILGVLTTFDAPRKLLPSSVLHNLQLCEFTMKFSRRRVDTLIEFVLLRSYSGFYIGHKVASFLRNHFLKHDGTITFFLKALKLACIKHFIAEPLSFFCFKDVASLKSALIGDPRSVIQNDLLNSDEYLQGTSCSRRGHVLSSSSHDTAITYSLAQEYGDLIKLHEWYYSFKTKVLIPSPKPKRKVQHSPTSKKGKYTSLENEVSIQARFCKAVTELQITGLVRMPSKRRPDFLQRICL